MHASQQALLRLADGRNLDLRVSGPPNGPTLLSHPGTPDSNGQLRAMATAAHRLGLRLVTTSRPGYGESTPHKGYRVLDIVTDTEAVLDFLGVSRCLVLGWSGGGAYALACGARLAQRVAALTVIASAAPYPVDGLDWTADMSQGSIEALRLSLQGEAALRPFLETAREKWLQTTPARLKAEWSRGKPAAEQAVLTDEVAEEACASGQEALRLGVDGYVDDVLARLTPWGFAVTEVAVPTRLWHGTQDSAVPVAHGHWLAGWIPTVVAHFERGDGHLSIGYGHMDQILQELVAASTERL
jgi:pimeloyl-ACP methyl ester carboxylesterase